MTTTVKSIERLLMSRPLTWAEAEEIGRIAYRRAQAFEPKTWAEFHKELCETTTKGTKGGLRLAGLIGDDVWKKEKQ